MRTGVDLGEGTDPRLRRVARANDYTIRLIVGDLVAVVASYLAAVLIAYGSLAPLAADPAFILTSILWIVLLWPTSLALFGLYQRRIDLSVVDTWPKIVGAASLATMLRLVAVLFVGGAFGVSDAGRYQVVVAAWALAVVTIPMARWAVRYQQRLARLRGVAEKRTLIIGAGRVGTLMADKMSRRPGLGLKAVGFLDADPMTLPEREPMGLPIYTDPDRLEQIIRELHVNHVLVAFTSEGFMGMFDLIDRAAQAGVEVSIVPRFFEIAAADPRTDEIEGVPVMTLERTRFSPALGAVKRAVDLLVSSIALVVFAPVMLAVAIAIKLEDRGPIMYEQTRLGRDSKPFTMYKFRSMVPDADAHKETLVEKNEATGPIFKMAEDPRVTRTGRFIRRYSLDELPQIFNVFKGDMSLVGPRPPLPSEADEYGAYECRRLSVKPGMTGLWQVLGRSELTFEEMVSLDLNYIWNWSPWLDISIMTRTIGAVIHGRGAY